MNWKEGIWAGIWLNLTLTLVVTVLSILPLGSSYPVILVVALLLGISTKFNSTKLFAVYAILVFARGIFELQLPGLAISRSISEVVTTRLSNILFLFGTIALLRKRQIRFNNPLLWVIGLFLFITILTIVTSGVSTVSLVLLFRFFQFLFFFFCLITIFTTPRDLYTFLLSISFAFIPSIIFLTLKVLLDPSRAAALGYFVFLLPITLAFCSRSISNYQLKKYQSTILVIALLGSGCLLLAESRRVVVGLVLAWVFFLSRFGLKSSYLGLLLLGAVFFSFLLPQNIFRRVNSTIQYLSGVSEYATVTQGQTNTVFSKRNILWDVGLQVFRENPIFGVGIGQSSRKTVALLDDTGEDFIRIHNLYIEILVEMGVIGFCVFLIYQFALLRIILIARSYSKKAGDTILQSISNALLDIFIIALFFNFFGNMGIFGKVEWCFNGIIVGVFFIARRLYLARPAFPSQYSPA